MSACADDRFARSEGARSATAAPSTSSESVPAETDCDGARSRPSSGGCDGSDKGTVAKSNDEELSSLRLPGTSGTTKNGVGVPSLPDRPEVVPVSEPNSYSPSPHHSVSGPRPGGDDGGSTGGTPLPSTDVGAGIAVDETAAASEEGRALRAAENDHVAAAVPGFLAEEAGGAGRRSGEGLVVARERMLRNAPLVYGEVEEVAAASEDKPWLRRHGRSVAAIALGLTLAAIIAAVLATQLPSGGNNDTNGELYPFQDNESVEKSDDAPFVGNASSVPPPMPSSPPSICSTERCRSIQSVLEPLVLNSSSLEDASSPQARALLWLADEDVRRVENASDAFNLTQRFAVATVYFATGGGEGTWREDANFLSGEHVCEWRGWPEENIGVYDELAEKGVSCYGTNAVLVLNLAHNNLTGSIPEEISLLPHLQFLLMYDNNIRGTIPEALSLLDNLQLLILGVNQIEGTIPNMSPSLLNLDLGVNALTGPVPTLTNLTNLAYLSLPYNYLTSTLPSFLDNPDLELLWLSSNYFEGPLSPSVSNLTSLRRLALEDNSITGTVPFNAELPLETLSLSKNLMNGTTDAAINHAPNVSQLMLSWNSFTGTLPNRLWELSNLGYLDLNNNLLSGTLSSQVSNLNRTLLLLNMRMNLLNGTIPLGIVELTNLESGLVLSENDFGGRIPEDIGNLGKLRTLSLWANNLTGMIPSSIGNMTDMNVLWLTMNALTGTVPRSFAQLTNLNFMSIDRNALTGNIDFLCDLGMKLIEADCLRGPENSSLIECSCCGRCCNAAATICDPPYSSSGL